MRIPDSAPLSMSMKVIFNHLNMHIIISGLIAMLAAFWKGPVYAYDLIAYIFLSSAAASASSSSLSVFRHIGNAEQGEEFLSKTLTGKNKNKTTYVLAPAQMKLFDLLADGHTVLHSYQQEDLGRNTDTING